MYIPLLTQVPALVLLPVLVPVPVLVPALGLMIGNGTGASTQTLLATFVPPLSGPGTWARAKVARRFHRTRQARKTFSRTPRTFSISSRGPGEEVPGVPEKVLDVVLEDLVSPSGPVKPSTGAVPVRFEDPGRAAVRAVPEAGWDVAPSLP